MTTRTPRIIASLLLALFLTTLAQAQPTTAPATQPGGRGARARGPAGPDPNSGPSDVAFEKTGRGGTADPTFVTRHNSFLARGKAGPIGVLFMGDSITEGWRNTGAADIFTAHYGKYDPANFGIGGDKTQHVLWRIDNGELDGIHPKVVVLMIGTNNIGDSQEAIYRGVKKIIDETQAKLPDARQLVLGIFPRGHDPATEPNTVAMRAKITWVNSQLAKLDDGSKIRYLDIGPKFLDPTGILAQPIMRDYLHPTTAGYQIWAESMQPLLDEMMKGYTPAAK
jgi:lysophospholipase L1-like esterase